MNDLTSLAAYDPNQLLDALIQKLGLKNDAALCRVLGVLPPVVSKIRHRTIPVGASLLIRMHDESGLSIKELRNLMGDQRKYFRGGTVGVEDMINKKLAENRVPE